MANIQIRRTKSSNPFLSSSRHRVLDYEGAVSMCQCVSVFFSLSLSLSASTALVHSLCLHCLRKWPDGFQSYMLIHSTHTHTGCSADTPSAAPESCGAPDSCVLTHVQTHKNTAPACDHHTFINCQRGVLW